jgi:uracil-DNA glycosylase
MPQIAIVGEAWGEAEAKSRSPFVGWSGQELTRMLAEAGIHRADCFLTNVFNLHPPANDRSFLCGPKDSRLEGYPKLLRGPEKGMNNYRGDYVRKDFAPELERLSDELIETDPNIVVALGNTALWALTGQTTISKLRGTTTNSTHCAAGFKVLPTYHPAAVLRQWDLRPVAVVDLAKALRESAFPEIRRPFREIWIEPDLKDIHDFFTHHVPPASLLSVDIETSGKRVTCIGFAPSPRKALVIPFTHPSRLGGNYWPTEQLDREVWRFVKGVLEDPAIPKLFQNGLYDITFLYRAYGIRVANAAEDSMLLHYSLQPESPKALAFLGSVYANEVNWKDMRQKKTTIKRDD